MGSWGVIFPHWLHHHLWLPLLFFPALVCLVVCWHVGHSIPYFTTYPWFTTTNRWGATIRWTPQVDTPSWIDSEHHSFLFLGGNTAQSCHFLRILVWRSEIVKEYWSFLFLFGASWFDCLDRGICRDTVGHEVSHNNLGKPTPSRGLPASRNFVSLL